MPKRQQAPGLWHLQGPVWYLGEMTLRTSPAFLCQAARGVWEGNPAGRASVHAVLRDCQEQSFALPSAPQKCHWILKHHEALTFATFFPLERRKMKFEVH